MSFKAFRTINVILDRQTGLDGRIRNGKQSVAQLISYRRGDRFRISVSICIYALRDPAIRLTHSQPTCAAVTAPMKHNLA